VASEIVGADVTMSILRDPNERTVSFLRHCKRHEPRLRGLSLEAIYDDAWMFPLLIQNYQSKLYSMTFDDKLDSHLDDIEVDDRRVEIAKRNVDRLDVLGLNDRYHEFLARVHERFGWRIRTVEDQRVASDDWQVQPSLRRRIADDNAADVEFYEYAKDLYERRERGAA
jgi:hypothetical protein